MIATTNIATTTTTTTTLDSKTPAGPLHEKWDDHKRAPESWSIRATSGSSPSWWWARDSKGASAAASFAELGYEVKCFCFQDSPRRAHSIAAQGGINAAKNYRNDGDSVFRLFYDTIKGGDFRSREANVYRLAQVSVNIIDQCVAQGVPFAREYGGLLDNRSFGGAQVSRTFYARGQTGLQLLLGAYQALEKEIAAGKVKMFSRTELLDVVLDAKGRAVGIITRDLVTGAVERHAGHAVEAGDYGNTATFITCRPMPRDRTSPPPGAPTPPRRPVPRTPASHRSIRPASRPPANINRN